MIFLDPRAEIQDLSAHVVCSAHSKQPFPAEDKYLDQSNMYKFTAAWLR